MDAKSKYPTDRLTHLLIEQAGWVPVDGGEYEEKGDSMVFRSDNKTILVSTKRVIALKYGAK